MSYTDLYQLSKGYDKTDYKQLQLDMGHTFFNTITNLEKAYDHEIPTMFKKILIENLIAEGQNMYDKGLVKEAKERNLK